MHGVNLQGQRFGRWLVLKEGGRSPQRQVLWICRCDCGASREVNGYLLRSGQSQSCGCLHRERVRQPVRHGHASTRKPSPEYNAWRSLIQRCTNPKHPVYKDYGGRGITVCRRWRASFSDFLADVGPRPDPKHEIDRINNDHGYEPGNVRWVTRSEQARNTRRTRHLTHNGRTQCVTDWALELGVRPRNITQRLARGWTVAETLSTPFLRKSTPQNLTGPWSVRSQSV